MRRFALFAVTASALFLGGCRVEDDTDPDARAGAQQQPVPQQPAQPAPSQPAQPTGDLELEVNLAQRELTVRRGGQEVERHPVAVGSSEWPTPTGEWSIGQVVFNPRWVPPQEEWAKDEEVREPGDPENPLGVAQLVYSPPNSIHGTNDEESIGKAVSHGSIRVTNDVAVRLARLVMEAGGAARDESFFQQARQNRSQRHDIAIPNPVPIRVVSGR